ncbi:MAG TPA: hypothetical protein VMZ92_21140 [Planctomycetota bacterium]|nr:hypothetical protein [Planctomycetota bacterium]
MTEEKHSLNIEIKTGGAETQKTQKTFGDLLRWPMMFARNVAMHIAVASWAFNQFRQTLSSVFDYLEARWQRSQQAADRLTATMTKMQFGAPGQRIDPSVLAPMLRQAERAAVPVSSARAMADVVAPELPGGRWRQAWPHITKFYTAVGADQGEAESVARLGSLLARNYPQGQWGLRTAQLGVAMQGIAGGAERHVSNVERMMGEMKGMGLSLPEMMATYRIVAEAMGPLRMGRTAAVRFTEEMRQKARMLRGRYGLQGLDARGRITNWTQYMESIFALPDDKKERLAIDLEEMTGVKLGARPRRFARLMWGDQAAEQFRSLIRQMQPGEAEQRYEKMYQEQLTSPMAARRMAKEKYETTAEGLRAYGLGTVHELMTEGKIWERYAEPTRMGQFRNALAYMGLESQKRNEIRARMSQTAIYLYKRYGGVRPEDVALGTLYRMISTAQGRTFWTEAGAREDVGEAIEAYRRGGVGALPRYGDFFEEYAWRGLFAGPSGEREIRGAVEAYPSRDLPAGLPPGSIVNNFHNGGRLSDQAALRSAALAGIGFGGAIGLGVEEALTLQPH